ncbi:MAG: hypothetical protein P9F75_11750 [Candidatus Contendobacter sp.]|nr:hypothetical protein [Candidatus Contendobacter sp.]
MANHHGASTFSSANRGACPKIAQQQFFCTFLALTICNDIWTLSVRLPMLRRISPFLGKPKTPHEHPGLNFAESSSLKPPFTEEIKPWRRAPSTVGDFRS